tara:strand:+ start:10236 stop:10955 length:720 start_codon:yes stop_codon:yes gene_type:complete
MKRHILFMYFLSLLTPVSIMAQEGVNLEKYRVQSSKKWESEVAKLEALDQSEQHPANSILFIGSSSIRKWNEIASDMAPYHPIRRGFGGSKWSDLAVFGDRLIKPHKFRALVCFVANDITGKNDDKSPDEVVALFSSVWNKARAHQPGAPIFYIAVTPTQARIAVWPKTKAANSAIRKFCANKPNTYFIGTESIYLDAQGKPRTELFMADKLHLNRDGYIRWAAAIKSQLDTALNGAGK